MDNNKYIFKYVYKYVNFINNKFDIYFNKYKFFFYFYKYIDFNKFINFNFNFFNNNSLMKKPTYVPHLTVYLWASQWCHGKKVLDIGCGEGYGLKIVSFFASDVRGVDISPQALTRANKLLPRKDGEVTAWAFDLEKHNVESLGEDREVILAFEVLEHIDNPEEVVVAMKGKTLIFSVPHDYPHRLHKRDYKSLEDVKKLVPGWKVDWYYLSGTNITEGVPEKIDRYIGVAKI